MKLGGERLKLIDVGVVRQTVVRHVILEEKEKTNEHKGKTRKITESGQVQQRHYVLSRAYIVIW